MTSISNPFPCAFENESEVLPPELDALVQALPASQMDSRHSLKQGINQPQFKKVLGDIKMPEAKEAPKKEAAPKKDRWSVALRWEDPRGSCPKERRCSKRGFQEGRQERR